jgi:dTDP-glucose 4,6-dehydratase|tara:strand:+ start:1296 stop:2282 length:987 start_codon:yes stop_codon:yes gene_type:complete
LQKRRFIITGGSGFVGQFLIRKLLSLYPESHIHNLDIHHPTGLSFSNLSNHIIDLTDQQSLKSFKFSENDIVFHLAAYTYIFTEKIPSKAKRERWFESLNVYGTQNLLATMEEDGAKNIAFLSSDMVYGSPTMTPVGINHPLNPNGPYGQSKIKAEKLISDFGAKKDYRSIIFRPRMIVGPGRFGLLNRLFFLIHNNLPVPLIGSGKNYFQFISVHDCIDALIKFNKQDHSSGIYHLGSANPPTVIDLINFIIKETNSSSFIIPTWGKGSKAILSFLDTINLTLLYPEQFMVADRDYVLDIQGLKDDLNIHPKFNDKDILLEAYRSYY